MRARSITGAGLAALAVAGLAACGGDDGGDGDLTEVRVGTASDVSYAPFFIADEMGFFEEHGLDVEITMTEGGPENWNPVSAGEFNLGTGSDSTIVPLMAGDPDLHAIGAFVTSESYVRVILDEELESAEDVSVMGASPGLSEMMLDAWLEYNGVDPDSIEKVESTAPELPTLMQRGDIEGFVLWEPWASMAPDYGGHTVADLGDFEMNFTHWIGTNADWFEGNEETAEAVLAAGQQGVEYLYDNWDEAVELVANRTNTDVDEADTMLSELDFEVVSLDETHLEAGEGFNEYFIEQGQIDAHPDYDSQVHLGFLD